MGALVSDVPVRFDGTGYPEVSVPAGKTLSRVLDARNSPLLFGCRTGICGTCVVEVHAGADALAPASDDEREILELYADDNPRARLACQLEVRAPLSLRALCDSSRWSGG